MRLGHRRASSLSRLSVSLLKPSSRSSVKDKKGSTVSGRRTKSQEPMRLASVIKRAGIKVRIR